MSRQLKPFCIALEAMISKLELDERFTFDRYGRSATFDSSAIAFPPRVRSVVASPADRRGFAERVLASDGPRQALADGTAWLVDGDRLHITRTRGSIIEFKLEVIHPKRPDASESASIPWLEISKTTLYFALDDLRSRVSE